jgi:hypothetical protein
MPMLHLELERAVTADRMHATAQAADRVHGTAQVGRSVPRTHIGRRDRSSEQR